MRTGNFRNVCLNDSIHNDWSSSPRIVKELIFNAPSLANHFRRYKTEPTEHPKCSAICESCIAVGPLKPARSKILIVELLELSQSHFW